MSEPTERDDVSASLGPAGVFVAGVQLPGIVADDVVVTAAHGGKNQLTVTFLVGPVTVAGPDEYPAAMNTD